MALTEAQQQQLRNWLDSKGAKPGCSVCGHTKWDAGDITNAPVFRPHESPPSTLSIPEVQVVCANCGYIMHFSAAQVGLLT